MRNQVARRAAGGVLGVAFIALVTLVVMSPHRFLYDEPDYANYVLLLYRYGLTVQFMNSLTGAAGPLHAFVHFSFEPLTQLQPVRMRLVNVFLLVVLAGILAAALRRQKRPDYWLSACSVLVVPMTWVVGGMALTEMSAMVFVTLSVFLQLRGLDALGEGRPVVWWFLASALFLGAALWGRQPYLLLGGVPVLLALLDRRLRVPSAIFAGVVVAAAMPLFLIWKGLAPPSQHAVQEGLSLTHGLTSFGYAGICFLLLAPRAKWLPWKLVVALLALTMAANALLVGYVIFPVRSVVDRYLSAAAVSAYGNLFGSLLLSCGVIFLVLLLRIIWEGRQDLKVVSVNAGLFCVAVSPMFVAHQYSSRYTAMSLPYLILAAEPWREWKMKTVLTTAVGCTVGFISLYGYFTQ